MSLCSGPEANPAIGACGEQVILAMEAHAAHLDPGALQDGELAHGQAQHLDGGLAAGQSHQAT